MKMSKPDLKYYTFITCEETSENSEFSLCTNSMCFSNRRETACVKAFEEYKKQYKHNFENCSEKVKCISFFNIERFYCSELCNNSACWICAEIRVFLEDNEKLSENEELKLQQTIKTLLQVINNHIRSMDKLKEKFTFGCCGHLALYDEFDIKFMIDN